MLDKSWVDDHASELMSLVDSEQRALAISLPDNAVTAAKEFQDILTTYSPGGQLHVTHKATDRTHMVARVAKEAGASVDVASIGELESCLHHDIPADKIIITGPKSTHFLARAVEVGVHAIVLDSFGELERLLSLNATSYPDILLRLSRSLLNQPGVTRVSRFGFDRSNYDKAIELLKNNPQLTLRGLEYHLDTKSIDEKTYAADVALQLITELSDRGIDTVSILDIGGGFGNTLGVTKERFNEFNSNFREAIRTETLDTYQSMSYGIKRTPTGQVVGDYTTMDVPAFPVGAERLKTILTTNSLATRAEDLLVDIWCEPGSAIFSDAGFVASEIIDVSTRDGHLAVTTNVQHGQVLFDRNEVIVEPILVPRKTAGNTPQHGYVFGPLCMESDVLSHRLIRFSQTPQPGDLLLWPHTGAYRMHMSQTNAIMHPDMARYRYENNVFTKEEL